MCEDLNARIIIKQGSGVPTIPVSADHRNGDWINTDIYEGEFYQDTATGLTYTRSTAGIIASSGLPTSGVWKARITQTGTNAPVLTVFVNTLGVTVTPNYAGVGTYTLTGFATLLTGNVEIEQQFHLAYLNDAIALLSTSSVIALSTYTSGVLANGVLISSTIIRTITVTVY